MPWASEVPSWFKTSTLAQLSVYACVGFAPMNPGAIDGKEWDGGTCMKSTAASIVPFTR